MELVRKKIGVFDSGIGGFSILKQLTKVLPGHIFFYISDFPHSPYGDRSSEYIKDRCFKLTNELLKENVDIILVACNTATAEAIENLRNTYKIPFVGVEPFVKSIEELNLNLDDIKPVVLTTPAMHGSDRFKRLLKGLDPHGRIHTHSCPLLASLIEEAHKEGIATVKADIELELSVLKNKGYTHAILGCTHYPLIANFITQYLNINCISPCVAVAKRVAFLLDVDAPDSSTELFFKISGEEKFKSIGPSLLSLDL